MVGMGSLVMAGGGGARSEKRYSGRMRNDTITLRVATPGDEEALTALIGAAYGALDRRAYGSGLLEAALPLMSRANPKLLVSGTYYVSEIAGEPVGCGGWSFQAPGTGDTTEGVAHIRHFATHPAHARKGIARVLLDHCLSEAAAAGAATMRAQATLPAEPFYNAAGFRRIGEVNAQLGAGVALPAIDMERPLP